MLLTVVALLSAPVAVRTPVDKATAERIEKVAFGGDRAVPPLNSNVIRREL